MKHLYVLLTMLATVLVARAQVTSPISLTTGTYLQDFNTLANSGISSTTPAGWVFLEAGTAANTSYTAGTGSSGTGDTYSFGATANSERAFGGLQSGSNIPTIGAAFTNNTGLSITSLTINYTGEQWRFGAAGRSDRLDFQYSLNATSLNTTGATWVDVDGLDFSSPNTTAAVGALDGNVAANRSAVGLTITGLNIANGATFFIRWNDVNASGADDGLAVDDFQLSFGTSAVVNTASVAPGANAAEPSTNGTFTVSLNNPAPAGGVVINYTLSGSATLATDYTNPEGGTVTIAQGASSATINVITVDDNLVEPTELVTVTLTAATNGYSIGTAGASINLLDNESTSVFQTDFTGCTGSLSDGFTQQNVIGAQVWGCTSFGRSGNGVEMNGFANSTNNANEDWLVSPALNLSATTNPILSFYSRTRFAGDALRLLITTNYTGDVTTTTWTELNGFFPAANSDVWTLSDNIDLSAYKQPGVRFAFKYVSTTTSGARWTLDDIAVVNSLTPPTAIFTLSNTLVDFRYQPAGTTSTSKSFTFSLNNLQSSVTLSAPANYELSKDDVAFSSSIVYTPAEAQAAPVVRVRLISGAASSVYSGYIQFAATNFNTSPVYVKGNSFDPTNTLNVGTWNIRFFGQTGTGSPDPVQQQANAKAVIEQLNPDVLAVAEIVDVSRFASLVSSLAGGYAYVLAEHCSGNGTTASACASQQKVGLMYKTSVMTNVAARAYMLSSATATANFASGRVPLLVSGTVTKNGQATAMNFFVVHAKANTGNTADQITAYQQRKAGNLEFKDSLEAQFGSSNIIMLGDFNDDLDRTIAPTTGADTVSSYQNFVADSTDAVSYRSVTLPLSYLKTRSTTDFDNVIDHMIVSNEMSSRILSQAATVYTDIQELTGINDYGTSTSDHYPVVSRYLFGGTLPVRFGSFTAVKQGTGVSVQWTTTQELNTRAFTIEHATDGRTFSALGTVAAINSSAGNNYTFIHGQPAAGTNYYRLKTVDLDGTWQTSHIVKLALNKTFTVSLLPNPAAGSVTVSLTGSVALVQAEMLNSAGQVVKEVRIANGSNKVSLAGLQPGLYLIRLNNGKEVITERLLVD